jgi:cbb3-type cytochrome oxidase maturation protein
MDILYLLIPFSVVLVFAIGVLFWWSLRHGQFEDLEGPAYRILMDDDTQDCKDGEADTGREKKSGDGEKR